MPMTISLLTDLLAIGLFRVRTDLLLWVVGIVACIAAVAFLLVQLLQQRRLKAELSWQDRLQRHDIEHELVLKAMSLCTWRIDVRERTITYVSDYRNKMDCYTPAPDTPLDDYILQVAPWDRQKMQQALEDIFSGRTDDYYLQYQAYALRSDTMYWSESYATVGERDEEGRPLSVIGTSMRIDAQKEMEAELIRARNKAEESDRLKSAFLANISHEVRTPLNAIVGFSDVMPMVESDDERQHLVSLIHENTAKLLRIFDDVMNMSRAEAGQSALQVSEFDLNTLLSELAGRYSEQNNNPAVVLTAVTGEGIEQVKTDRNRLYDILGHFLSNALKFTEKGHVTIGFRRDAAAGRLRVYVSDTGKGIPEEECSRIFERFVKLDEFVQGAGLGLSVCRSFAYSLGGTVGVESKVGVGSTFWVDLPA